MKELGGREPVAVIAADVGGTKASLALFREANQLKNPPDKQRYINREFNSFGEVLAGFLQNVGPGRYALCVGAAGPVRGNHVAMTNINWSLDGAELQKAFGFEGVWLLNDLQAAAEGITHLGEADVQTLLEGKPGAKGNLAIISPGTGLGQAYITFEDGEARTQATEGGHSDFAPTTAQQAKLLAYLSEKQRHVSVEDVCSGIGIANIYAFLADSGRLAERGEHVDELQDSDDLPATIFGHALAAESHCSICGEVLRIFMEVLGSEAGNLALKVGASGGVYIGGGIPPKIRKAFESGVFAKYFLHKGRRKDYMARVPVRLVLNSKLPLIGAAHYAFEQLKIQE